jgi:hypothetical protein
MTVEELINLIGLSPFHLQVLVRVDDKYYALEKIVVDGLNPYNKRRDLHHPERLTVMTLEVKKL